MDKEVTTAPGMPKTPEEWETMREETQDALHARGLRLWDNGLMLIPHAWYPHIPVGYVLECINGKLHKFRPYPRNIDGRIDWAAVEGENADYYTDDDRRFGYLAYGIQCAP
jgi:hypothetical protein